MPQALLANPESSTPATAMLHCLVDLPPAAEIYEAQQPAEELGRRVLAWNIWLRTV
jgi:hypothetical protein